MAYSKETTLKEVIASAEELKKAIPHFNVSNLETLNAVFRAALKTSVPVVIGLSEGERDFVGLRQGVAMVKSLREEHNFPIYINADHTYSVERVKEAIDAGFDSVIFDGAGISLEENVEKTKECVEYAKSKEWPVLVEAELGYIGKSSKLLEEIPEGAAQGEMLTRPEAAEEFVKKTGVDLLAPAVGNLHGMMKTGGNPKIDTERIRKIRETSGVPLVLHGGSGISDEDFTEAIRSGISMIHISTELRVAYKKALQEALQEKPDEIAPYKLLSSVVSGVSLVAERRMKLFWQE